MRTRRQLGSVGFAQAAAAPLIAGSGPAAPFVAAALLAAPFVMKLFKNVGKGCGQSCVLTADAANQIEEALKLNLAAYFKSGRTKAEQAGALQVFDAYWQALTEYCGQPEFQTTKAGRNCIEDRRRGACVWKESGECWNWFVGYRDPIANDAAVDASSAAPGQSETATGGHDLTRYVIPAALVILALSL